MAPDAPRFGPLKLASPADILRLGIVCAAGFRYSEQFIWERTAHEQPQSTIVCFRHEVQEFIRDPQYIALVILDGYDPGESSKTIAVIPKDNGWTPPAAGTPVVVGLGVWKLEASSKRIGHFQNDDKDPYPDLPEYDYKDLDRQRSRAFEDVAGAAAKRYFGGLSEMERVVVHPAYWKKGHGSKIAKWGVDLADLDNADQGVLATSMGANLFRHVGYEFITNLHVDGDGCDPEGVTFEALRHRTGQKDQGLKCNVL